MNMFIMACEKELFITSFTRTWSIQVCNIRGPECFLYPRYVFFTTLLSKNYSYEGLHARQLCRQLCLTTSGDIALGACLFPCCLLQWVLPKNMHLAGLPGRTTVGTRLACVRYGRCQVLPGCRVPRMHLARLSMRATVGTRLACVQYGTCQNWLQVATHAYSSALRACYGRYQACLRAAR